MYMRRIWKELVILCGFIAVFCFLILEHEQYINGVITKEIPYILLILVTIIFILWCYDKLNHYQTSSKLNEKLHRLSDQYNLDYDERKSTKENSSSMLDQIEVLLKKDELNINAYEYRYRLIANITNQIVFEYNLKNNTFCNSDDWKKISDGKHFIQECILKSYIHPDDVEIFENYFFDQQIVGSINEVIVRIRYHQNDTYHKTKLRGIVLSSLDGTPEKIIGTRSLVEEEKQTGI